MARYTTILLPLRKALFLVVALLTVVNAFAPKTAVSHQARSVVTAPSVLFTEQVNKHVLPAALSRQRRSVAAVQTQGLFGLGFAEIAIVAAAIAFVLGPQTIGKLAGSALKQTDALKDELQKVPEEFRKGMEEGEMDARARKAKPVLREKADE